jgi:predicted nuclease with TOPRIM domain
MTYKDDLQRIRNSVNWIFTEADQLREKLNQEIEKNAILQKQIEERDSEINQLKIQIDKQEFRNAQLEVDIVDEYIK